MVISTRSAILWLLLGLLPAVYGTCTTGCPPPEPRPALAQGRSADFRGKNDLLNNVPCSPHVSNATHYIMFVAPISLGPGESAELNDCTFSLPADRRITKFSSYVKDEHDAVLGSPPIHMHHVHVFQQQSPDYHLFVTHGDFMQDGVEDPYAMTYGNDSCVHIPPYWDLRVRALLNHNANQTLADVTGRFYIEFRFSTSCKVVDQVWIQSPRDNPKLWATYAVPATKSVAWWSVKFPHFGDISNVIYHGHNRRLDVAYLIRGKLGCHASLEMLRSSAEHPHALLGESASVRAYADEHYICRIEGAIAQLDGAWYDRRNRVECRPNAWLERNETITVIAFHDVRYSPAETTVWMHDVVWIHTNSKGPYSSMRPLASKDINSRACDWEGVGQTDYWSRIVNALK